MLHGSFLRPSTAGQPSRSSGPATEIIKSLEDFKDRITSERENMETFKGWRPIERARKKSTDQIEVLMIMRMYIYIYIYLLAPFSP